MSNDIVDLTDRFNDLLEAYQLGDGEAPAIVDLDAWSDADLDELESIVIQANKLRRDYLLEEYDAVFTSVDV